MKKLKPASSIIASLCQERHFAPLKRNFYCKDFLSLLSPMHQNLISKIFIKKQLLIILTKSNVGYQELNHDNTKKSIKKLIKIYANTNSLSDFDQINELKILTDRNFKLPTKSAKKKKFFLELSKGEFKNTCKNELLYQGFEDLRAVIKGTKVC
ncbi:hypothetical protein CQA38_09130 [Campylobacter sp. MIT 12-5580]|nr:hypothetical protein CQA38_09130 [Campylobacter sp. MIT 12-5580]